VAHQVNLFDEVRAVVATLPVDARKVFYELVELLEIQPHAGEPYRPPDSDLRTAVLADGRLLVVWLILDSQDRVEVLRVMHLDGGL
jgi:hypothetical protein